MAGGAGWPRTSEPRVHRVQPVDVLARIDPRQQGKLVEPSGLLDEKRGARRIGIQLVDHCPRPRPESPSPEGRGECSRLRFPRNPQCFAPTYQRLAGSSPTRIVPSPGSTPRAPRSRTRSVSSAFDFGQGGRAVEHRGGHGGRSGSVGEVAVPVKYNVTPAARATAMRVRVPN